APLDLGRPQPEQPLMELVERAAVVLVVGADVLEDLALARLEPLFERDHRAAAAAHLLAALEAVERLDLLDRVAVEREPHRLADDAEEVDEHLAAQQVAELGLARAVPAHQPRPRGSLVRRLVLDVASRDAPARLAGQAAVSLERCLLAELGERLGAELRELLFLRGREILGRRDPGGVEPVDLRAPNPGDQREVLVPFPLLLAAREELAERTVVD